jgi:hypothetical protein
MCGGNIRWGTFPDGYPNTFISRIDELRNTDVVFLADFQNPADLFEQFSCMLLCGSLLFDTHSLTRKHRYSPTPPPTPSAPVPVRTICRFGLPLLNSRNPSSQCSTSCRGIPVDL